MNKHKHIWVEVPNSRVRIIGVLFDRIEWTVICSCGETKKKFEIIWI